LSENHIEDPVSLKIKIAQEEKLPEKIQTF
jgi:hypothetical protein